jgi:arabinan endo-1,5-alpha-L-arabinosidase
MKSRRIALSIAFLVFGSVAVPSAVLAEGIRPSPSPTPTPIPGEVAPNYENPLDLQLPNGEQAMSCADPDVIRGQEPSDINWYLYCTSDPLTEEEVSEVPGATVFHNIPIFRSTDLVHWTYTGDAFATKPAWITGGVWAPDIAYANGQYLLYYAASETNLPGGASAVGVATSDSPTGPWTDTGTPVVEPAPGGQWRFDPEFLSVDGTNYLYFGSYFGGVFVRELSDSGLTSDPATEQRIAIDNRYEGTEIIQHDGWFYFFGSATNCCNGPLTGYSVFAARSESPLGPFVDEHGVSILEGRVGGTPAITQNGNRWVGPGHNTVFTDFSGQDWTIYHAIDRNDPYFVNDVGFTKRPALLDPIDWVNGWPVLRGGQGPSDEPMPGPAAEPGQVTAYQPEFVEDQQPGRRYAKLSDQFGGKKLDDQWTWVRPPDPATYGVRHGELTWQTQDADLHPELPALAFASVLNEPAPQGNYVVETKVSTTIPAEGCCQNYVQGGIVIYSDDGNYVKLVVVSIWNTRQTEFGKEITPVLEGYPNYGNTVVGPVGDETYLRIVREQVGDTDVYTPYTSMDGENWDRGGAWTHDLGNQPRIGLVSMGGPGDFETSFDYVRVSALKR